MKDPAIKKESVCVSVDKDSRHGVVTPVYPSTAFQYVDEGQQYYPRYFNTPNQDSVTTKLAKLERTEDGVLFGSGMAAISTAMLSLLSPGDHVVCLDGLYGGTHKFLTSELERLGISFSFAGSTVDELAAAINGDTKMIYVESPTNPTMTCVDLAAVAKLAKESGCVSVIDNTFASPICQTPADLGIDIVIHSGTKYLGGHSDLTCGAVLGPSDLMDGVRQKALHYGGTTNSLTCYLIERSLKTLAVRVQRQCENAMTVATALEQHVLVGNVFYPGLNSSPYHEIASRQMDQYGGMLSFELSDPAMVGRFLESLQIITPALSLGGVESTVCVPGLTSHRGVPREERERVGITDSLIRYSVGIEHIDDLIGDLETAIQSAANTVNA
ncbi:MAG: PLP-dependent aspartate aminotransferase family protein [Planctomycetota bacterium]